MAAPNRDETTLPTTSQGLDAYLAEAMEETGSEESGTQTADADRIQPDPERKLTVYGAMLLATEAAVDALDGQALDSEAQGFEAFLVDFLNNLRS